MGSKAKTLSSLFQAAVKPTKTAKKVEDAVLKQYVSSTNPTSASFSLSEVITNHSIEFSKSKKAAQKLSVDVQLSNGPNARLQTASELGDCTGHLTKDISSILSEGAFCSPDLQQINDENSSGKVLDIPWISNITNDSISMYRKDKSRERKEKWVFKYTQVGRFNRLVSNCAQKLGTDATIEVFGKLGRETGLKEYNALIMICIEKARTTNDVEVVLDQIANVFELFRLMKEQGFQLEDETYGPILMYLIEMGMTEEFGFFCEAVKNANPSSLGRLGYYEMLLSIKVDNEDKIQELCSHVIADNGVDNSSLRENYLLALCESDRKKEILQLLESIDITKLSSLDYVVSIFECLGRLSFSSAAEKFLPAFKNSENRAENITDFIFSYVVSIPNLAVEDVISKFKDLHNKMEMKPSSASYEKLINFCCDLLKVDMALDIVNEMCEGSFMVSTAALHSILRAIEESCEFNLVHQVYSIICRHNLNPNTEIFRSMISLCVKMKDFDGAYNLLRDVEKMNLTPTTGMYNAIMGGYFREKNISGGLAVLKKMELADIKPDSQTFSYLISNSDSEENIIKYFDELKSSGVQMTKQIFMALINAYAACGQFEKAKQVISDKRLPVKNLLEIRSVLVSALAFHGQMSDALCVYEEMKQTGCDMEPKAIYNLIEHLKSDGELSRLLQLLDEISDSDYWTISCRKIILYCVQYKHLSTAVDLLKQLKDKYAHDDLITEVIFDEVFAHIADLDPTHLEVGLELLRVIKHVLHLSPSRKCLDFLLAACVNAKDLKISHFIWKEYQLAGLPYNVLSFLRMYQALLACGDFKSAKLFLRKIPKDDPHVRYVILGFQKAYLNITPVVKLEKPEKPEKTEKKKKKELKEKE